MTYEGSRFKIEETDYYRVRTYLSDKSGSDVPTWSILDEEDGGYIAFTTSEATAERICAALTKDLPA